MKRNSFLLMAAIGWTGCGDSATATLHLYDAAPEGVTAVDIYVAAADVHVVDKTADDKDESSSPNDTSIDNDDSWQHLDINRSINLMEYEGETAATVLGKLDLPAGKITQIRLVLDKTQPNTATYNGTDCNLDLAAVETKGIKINHVFKAFEVKDGSSNDLFLHFDLDSSLTASGNCFALHPKLSLEKATREGKGVDL